MYDSLQDKVDTFSAQAKVMFVDDDVNLLTVIRHALKNEGYEIITAKNGEEGVELFKKEKPDLVFLDIQMPVMDGLQALGEIKKIKPEQFVIILSGHDDLNVAFDAVRAGAYDFLQKPFEANRIKLTISNALRNIFISRELMRLEKELHGRFQFENIVGQSGRMMDIFNSVQKVLNNSVTIMILGESGTGKELIARAIHEHSPERKNHRFVAVNCAALPENLLESELFGHEKGAFTGATERRVGMFEYADGGTLFLDEIGEMPLAMQAKLIRVLQEREFTRLGSNKTIKTNVRIISATNRDLKELVENKQFREDLYFRLSVFPIVLPPLRERKEDILPLCRFFLEKHSKNLGYEKLPNITKEAYDILMHYDWPGNVRELENTIERALIQSMGETIFPHHLTPSILSVNKKENDEDEFSIEGRELPEIVADVEKKVITKALEKYKNNLSDVARVLGIGRSTLYRKIEQYGLETGENLG